MVDLKDLAERVYQNKLEKHFNVTDLPMEICYIHGKYPKCGMPFSTSAVVWGKKWRTS